MSFDSSDSGSLLPDPEPEDALSGFMKVFSAKLDERRAMEMKTESDSKATAAQELQAWNLQKVSLCMYVCMYVGGLFIERVFLRKCCFFLALYCYVPSSTMSLRICRVIRWLLLSIDVAHGYSIYKKYYSYRINYYILQYIYVYIYIHIYISICMHICIYMNPKNNLICCRRQGSAPRRKRTGPRSKFSWSL